MPHSNATRPGKRERLVAAAAELVYHNGVETTTLAQIASAADVPPGNVYYYFKTREELLKALVESRRAEIRERLSSLERRRTPQARLKGLAELWAASSDQVAEHGCPLGCLTSELGKTHPDLGGDAAGLFEEVLAWSEQQFREMGHRDARGLATTLFAGVQGAAVLADVLHDPELMRREVRRLDRWIDELGPQRPTTARARSVSAGGGV
jgi:TetR/AcrR family transcriptional regulator, transcriptional repressor for nem operon